MLPFRTSRGATFCCEADFSNGAAVNLHFFDHEQATIPFHVSLRRNEQLIVVNRREHGGWQREIKYPAAFTRDPVRVTVRFHTFGVSLRVNDRLIGRYDALPRPSRDSRFFLQRGFTALADIGFVDIEGALVPDSVLVDCPAVAPLNPGRPVLTEALEVVLAGLTADDVLGKGRGELRISGFAEGVPAVLRALAYVLPGDKRRRRAYELAAVVPGRVWDGGADALEMTLFGGDGAALGAVTVTRAELAQHIGDLAVSGVLRTVDRVALQAIEHARHAGILPYLSGDERAGLQAAAERFGLVGYLLEREETKPVPAPAVPIDPAWQMVDEVRNRFTRTMRDAPGGDPIAVLGSLLSGVSLAPQRREALLVSLTEWFCSHGDPRDLAAFWRVQKLPPLTASALSEDVWHTSAMLPLLYLQGQFDDVARAIEALVPPSPQWVVTPTLGWVLGAVARGAADQGGQAPCAAQTAEIVAGGLAWFDARALDYWGRTPCLALIDGVVALLVGAAGLRPDQADALTAVVLENYALTPAFWAAADTAKAALPDDLQAARAAFADLRSGMAGAAGIDAILDRFHDWGTIAAAQFRRELLGVGTALPDRAAAARHRRDADEATLRYLAFPRAQPPAGDLSPAVQASAATALRVAHNAVQPGPFADVQARVLQRATVLTTGPDAVCAAQLADDMVTLATPMNRYLGVGVALSLASVLLSQSREDEADKLVKTVITAAIGWREPWVRYDQARAPAPSLALAALLRDHPGHPLTDWVVAALDDMRPLTLLPAAKGVNALLNTVVCLYSCRANLDTRVKTIREGWMRQLAEMGVPCLVFVGDGDGTIDGDVVALDAPDDYEGLPQKSLAMVRWVLENTAFAYLVKVDDDCFLDAAAFFGDLAYQKSDYYGRPLTRTRGQMDRTWHMAKSTHPRGRFELDKSPEPSYYADGGSGYALSRLGMAALCETAQTAAGQDLIHLSFMEDKLVGDLLAQRNIPVIGEDYRISVLRRTKPGGPLVPAWQNGFLPFAGGGVKLAHLDGHDRQAEALAGSHSPWPRPHKVWPGYQPVKLGWSTNALDLISSAGKLARVNAAPVAVVACLRNEMFTLPRFLEHYRALGVTGFLIADNGSDDGSFEYLDAQPDVALFAVDTEYSASHYGVAWQQALIGNFRVGRWSLMADADEFLFWTKDLTGSLPDLVQGLDAEGADAARIFMLDMYPKGSLSEVDFKTSGPFDQAPYVDREPFLSVSSGRGPFSNSSTCTSGLRHRLIPGSRTDLFVAQKYALLKYQPWMRLSAGLHFVADCVPSQQELLFAHFKYNAAFRAKAEAEVARQQHFNNAEEYRKYLAVVSEGRDVVFDDAVSVRWDACDFVRARMT